MEKFKFWKKICNNKTFVLLFFLGDTADFIIYGENFKENITEHCFTIIDIPVSADNNDYFCFKCNCSGYFLKFEKIVRNYLLLHHIKIKGKKIGNSG